MESAQGDVKKKSLGGERECRCFKVRRGGKKNRRESNQEKAGTIGVKLDAVPSKVVGEAGKNLWAKKNCNGQARH